MNTVIFETEEAIFQFNRHAVMECLKHRKTLYEIQELDLLLDVISSQPEKANLSFEEHRYIGYIALELIKVGEGSVFCNNCGKRYRFNQLQAFTVGPDNTTFKDVRGKEGVLKNLFRKKSKRVGIHGGEGYKCPKGCTLIYLVAWIT